MEYRENRGMEKIVAGYIGSKTKDGSDIEKLYHRIAPEISSEKNIRFENIDCANQDIREILIGESDYGYLLLEEDGEQEKYQMYFYKRCAVWDGKNGRPEPDSGKQESFSGFLKENMLQVNLKGRKVFLEQQQIVYLERSKRITHIHTEEGVISTSEKLEDLLNRVRGEMFIRCHNSFAINLKHVTSYSRTAAALTGGKLIPISRKYCKSTRKAVCGEAVQA